MRDAPHRAPVAHDLDLEGDPRPEQVLVHAQARAPAGGRDVARDVGRPGAVLRVAAFRRPVAEVVAPGHVARVAEGEGGEVAPFVGHNAFLRWSAVQDAAFVDPADGKTRQWSEANVSEDFDLALRLLLKGYTLRWATYSNGGFKEGVSLTVVDELARWQKYAYGMCIFCVFIDAL